MRKESKVDLVKDLTNKFKENNIFYLLDASGLTVAQVNAFREKCFKRDVEYKVVKNTFIKKALDGQDQDFSQINILLLFSIDTFILPGQIQQIQWHQNHLHQFLQ